MRQPASAKEASTSILAKQLGWDSSAIVEKQKHTRWIVQDFIAAGSVAWLYGAPGSYKTFAALDIAMSVATGKPWQGREVSQGAVLFIAAEGGDDIHIRRAAWVERHGVEGLLKITDNRPQIDSQKEDEYEGRQVFRYSGSGQLKEAIDVLNVSLDDVGHEL
jgi:RecA/RadA recombinase